MDARELRIGNWIERLFEDESIGIEQCTIRTIWDVDKQDSKFSFKPIPINEELLLRLGFELEYKSDFTIKYTMEDSSIGYDWSKMRGWSFRYFGDKIKCEYVHQLQNLVYSLTGTELVLQERGEKV